MWTFLMFSIGLMVFAIGLYGFPAVADMRLLQETELPSRPLSQKTQEILGEIRGTPKESVPGRIIGKCLYDWKGWKLYPNGIRVTYVDCGGTAMRWKLAVSCDKLLVSHYSLITPVSARSGEWGAWVKPAGPDSKFRAGEDEAVATLCANVLPSQ